MASLKPEHQRFIVQALARYRTPSEVVVDVKEEFGIDVTRQGVQYYDPERGSDDKKLATEWVDLFRTTRDAFPGDLERIAIYHASWRLEELLRMYRAVTGGKHPNRKFAADLLAEARAEVDAIQKRAAASGQGSTSAALVEALALLKKVTG